MKDKLILEHDRNSGVWRISWFLAEDQETGATLGKGYWDVVEDDKEHYVAQNAAFNTPGVEQDSAGFFWDNEKLARAALKMCKEALKQEKSMPAWAIKALSEGWKAPKGWKA